MARKKEAPASPFVPEEEQPYPIPENWCWVRLNSVRLDKDGFFDGDWILSENMDADGEVRLLQLSDIGIGDFLNKSNRHINIETFQNLKCKELLEGDLIISRMAEPIARSCIVPKFSYKVITAVDIAVMRCNPYVIKNNYLNYICNAKWFTDSALKMARGTTRVRITRRDLSEIPIPLAPLPEQQRIVTRIESLFTKLDEAKEKVQAVVDGFELRKSAILHKAFTGELTAKWRKERGISLDSWRIARLGELTEIVSSKRIYKEEYVESGIPFFRSSEIVDLNDFGYTEPQFFISHDRYEEIKTKYGVPEQGDLLVTSVGTIGKTWIVDNRSFYYKDGNLTQVKNCSTLDMRYLQLYIQSEGFKEQIRSSVAGSAYNALTIVKFKKIEVPIPLQKEQLEIVHILDKVFEQEQQAKSAAEAVLSQIETMKKAILARAFRGELGTNDPAEESAAELLNAVLGE